MLLRGALSAARDPEGSLSRGPGGLLVQSKQVQHSQATSMMYAIQCSYIARMTQFAYEHTFLHAPELASDAPSQTYHGVQVLRRAIGNATQLTGSVWCTAKRWTPSVVRTRVEQAEGWIAERHPRQR